MLAWMRNYDCLGSSHKTSWRRCVSSPPSLSILSLHKTPSANSSVAVFGCGCIGLGVINGAAQVGASRIIAVDTNSNKESWAKRFGAHEFVNPNDLGDKRIQDHLVEITDGGLDFTFDCTGNVCASRSVSGCRWICNFSFLLGKRNAFRARSVS